MGVASTPLSLERAHARASSQLQDADDELGEVTLPRWTVVLRAYEDPYERELIYPAERPAGVRYVGVEVELRNQSEVPWSVSPGQFRLREVDGAEYPSGGGVGIDPRLVDINMLPAERTRGWILFQVPEAVQSAFLVYAAPPPRLELAVGDGGDAGAGTPESE